MGIGAQSSSNIGLRNPEAVYQFVPGTYFASNTDIKVNGAPNNTRATRTEGIDATPTPQGDLHVLSIDVKLTPVRLIELRVVATPASR